MPCWMQLCCTRGDEKTAARRPGLDMKRSWGGRDRRSGDKSTAAVEWDV
jgi:hypothetical protein